MIHRVLKGHPYNPVAVDYDGLTWRYVCETCQLGSNPTEKGGSDGVGGSK